MRNIDSVCLRLLGIAWASIDRESHRESTDLGADGLKGDADAELSTTEILSVRVASSLT